MRTLTRLLAIIVCLHLTAAAQFPVVYFSTERSIYAVNGDGSCFSNHFSESANHLDQRAQNMDFLLDYVYWTVSSPSVCAVQQLQVEEYARTIRTISTCDPLKWQIMSTDLALNGHFYYALSEWSIFSASATNQSFIRQTVAHGGIDIPLLTVDNLEIVALACYPTTNDLYYIQCDIQHQCSLWKYVLGKGLKTLLRDGLTAPMDGFKNWLLEIDMINRRALFRDGYYLKSVSIENATDIYNIAEVSDTTAQVQIDYNNGVIYYVDADGLYRTALSPNSSPVKFFRFSDHEIASGLSLALDSSSYFPCQNSSRPAKLLSSSVIKDKTEFRWIVFAVIVCFAVIALTFKLLQEYFTRKNRRRRAKFFANKTINSDEKGPGETEPLLGTEAEEERVGSSPQPAYGAVNHHRRGASPHSHPRAKGTAAPPSEIVRQRAIDNVQGQLQAARTTTPPPTPSRPHRRTSSSDECVGPAPPSTHIHTHTHTPPSPKTGSSRVSSSPPTWGHAAANTPVPRTPTKSRGEKAPLLSSSPRHAQKRHQQTFIPLKDPTSSTSPLPAAEQPKPSPPVSFRSSPDILPLPPQPGDTTDCAGSSGPGAQKGVPNPNEPSSFPSCDLAD